MKEKKVRLLLKEIMLKYFREAVQCENKLRLSDAGRMAEGRLKRAVFLHAS